ncbi:MAG: hypothetical protein QGG09_01220, partial [Pirellulaceae bacterium]|nr:hypothetical protein [Pirellulaceae bacterium]
MRTLAILVGMGCSLFAMHAIGQDLQQPRSTQSDSFAYNSYYQEAQPSPSDLRIESQSSDESSKERAGKGGKGKRSSGWLGDRWTMDGF